MKKNIGIILIFLIFILSSCSRNSNNAKTVENNGTSNINNSSCIIEKEHNNQDNYFKATYKDKLNPSLDFDNIYSLCKEAAQEYCYSLYSHNAMNYDKYIQNPNLKEYINFRYLNDRVPNPRNEECCVGLLDIEWILDNQNNEFVYICLSERYGDDYSCRGNISKMIVKNIDGNLIIVDWYCEDKLSSDTTIRGDFQEINNSDFWNNDEKANELIMKIKALINKSMNYSSN